MKRNNVAKRFGIATLCLATAISAFSGITSFATSNVAVAEETTTSVWGDFITTSEGATVSTDSSNRLNVSSATPYEATFNQIFYGNIQLRFVFPETHETTLANVWGDFKFRITDAADENNFFDIEYVQATNGTVMRVVWNGHTLQCANAATTYDFVSATYLYDDEIDGRASYVSSPSFMGVSSTRGTRTGRLTLKWGAAGNTDQLWVTTNGPQKSSDKYAVIVAKFDGSYDETATQNGFVNKSKWGLPKMTFPHGYKISFSSDTGEKDATDVCFTSIINDGTTSSKAVVSGGTSQTSFTEDNFTTNNYMKAYDKMTENAGKTLLGWKDDTGLYPTATALASDDIGAYTPVFLGFDTMKGASVRIDPTGGQSGLRFMTLFDKADYATAAPYIQSQGTLIAYTSALTKGRFDAVNYATEIAADPATTVAQVENSKDAETGELKMFNYNVATNRVDDENGQPAYSMALVGISDYTQEYSARGYIVVVYADATTQTIYTDYNETDNSRSIAEVAYKVQQLPDYQNYTAEQQAVVDGYAAEYVAE